MTRAKKPTKIERQLRIALAALNNIACWGDGPEVTGAFDEPGSAYEARKALKDVEATR